MMDSQPCPACGGDSDSCYCPGVLLTSPAEWRTTAPGAANPRPAVPPPVVGEHGLEWRTPRRWVEPYRYTSAQIHETCQPALLAASAADHWAGERAYYLGELAQLQARREEAHAETARYVRLYRAMRHLKEYWKAQASLARADYADLQAVLIAEAAGLVQTAEIQEQQ